MYVDMHFLSPLPLPVLTWARAPLLSLLAGDAPGTMNGAGHPRATLLATAGDSWRPGSSCSPLSAVLVGPLDALESWPHDEWFIRAHGTLSLRN